MTLNRRSFVQASALGVAAGGTLVAYAGRVAATHDGQAASHNPVLDAALLAVADAIGDALVPGVAAAGFASYLDSQLACPPEQSLLIARYLGIEPPYRNFYIPALQAVDAWARTRYGNTVSRLDAGAREHLAQDLADGNPAPWHGAPAAFVHFVLRADAVDVGYGTRAGFARLGIPYMAHIEPERDW
ncbi:MAG TPA: gluconate 2-dehydrogenase subunit 3 family protein [Pseudomonadales bacterium]|nr:gluconate 2-dehydrogenase subunit 3 family protein [Pseudomonadales bacterium]